MARKEGHYDVVVAGAGPAGSAAARILAQEGFRVLLLEEHEAIGMPLHCSGLVTHRTLDEAKVGDSLVLNSITGARIHAPSGEHLTLGDGKPHALVIDRVGLDHALADEAQRHGAELLLGSKLVSVERHHHGRDLRVWIEKGGSRSAVTARLLVGADGAHSQVARQTGLAEPGEHIIGLGAEGILPCADEDHVNVFVGRSLAPGWFAWTIPLGQGMVRLGVGTSDTMKPVEGLRQLFASFPEHFTGWQATRWTGGTIPLWSRRNVVTDNVMLIGDAAAQVKPTSGGGIYPGLVGARIAAHTAITALMRDDLSSKALDAYPKAWGDVLGKEFKQGSDLRRVFKSLDDRDFDRLIRLFGRPRLLRTINRHGDIDFPGHVFERLTKLAPILWMFVRTPLRYTPLWK